MMREEISPFAHPVYRPLLALVCALLWGSAATFIKLGYAQLQVNTGDTASQLLFAGCRFTLAGLLTLLIFSLVEKRVLKPTDPASWTRIAALASTQTVLQYFSFYIGVAHTTGTTSAIINGCNPFLTILAAIYIFRGEKMSRDKAIGCLFGLAAVLLMNYSGLKQGLQFTVFGEGFLFLSMAGNISSTNLAKRYSVVDDPVMLSGYQFVCGGLILALLGFLLGGRLHFNAMALLILLWLAMVSAVAYSFWSLLLKYNEVSRIAIYNSLTPVFGLFFSAVFLKETAQAFHPLTLLSLALVSGGIIIINRRKGTHI